MACDLCTPRLITTPNPVQYLMMRQAVFLLKFETLWSPRPECRIVVLPRYSLVSCGLSAPRSTYLIHADRDRVVDVVAYSLELPV